MLDVDFVINEITSNRPYELVPVLQALNRIKNKAKLAQQTTNKQSTPLCEFYGCFNLATELRCEKHFGLVN